MVDFFLRPAKDRILSPVVSFFARRFEPNTLSIIGFGIGLATAAAAAFALWPAALGFWVANRFFDGLDGAVARASGKQSDRGGYLDIFLDFAVYAVIPLAIA